MMKGFSIVGIGTGVGKTVVSAIVSEALNAIYFKPVQAGDLDQSDSILVRRLCSENVEVAQEAFLLNTPMAPHGAAKIDGIEMKVSDIEFPLTQRPVVVEGAGGLMVPINEDGASFIDIYKKADLPIVLVSRHYLGSINHTLLTIDKLQAEEFRIAGIIYVGEENKVTEEIIEKVTSIPTIARIPFVDELNADFIKEQSVKCKGLIYELS